MDDRKDRFAGLLAHDTMQVLATRLEAFADGFERLAQSRQQHALAARFIAAVPGLIAEPLARLGLDSVERALAAYADGFERVARTAEQKELAGAFRQFAGEIASLGGQDTFLERAAQRAEELARTIPTDSDGRQNPDPAMTLEHRLAGFQALLASHQTNSYFMVDADGEYRLWEGLSPAGKLGHLASDSVYYDLPFEPFAAAVREVLGELPASARDEAALQLVWQGERERRGLGQLLPEHDRVEPAPPLVERFRDLLDHYQTIAARAPARDKDTGIER